MNSKKKLHYDPHKPTCSNDFSKSSTEGKTFMPESIDKVSKQKPSIRIPKDARNPRNTCQRKYYKPHIPPQKSAPVHVHISNPSAEVVLRERNVEIKDLESQVVFLKTEMKEHQIEKKTLKDLLARQEKELRKFKAGVTDLPSMLKSHKDEMKAVESSAFSLRRELKGCQKDLKSKNDIIMKKEQQIEKMHFTLKRNEKQIQDATTENRELRLSNKKYEEECKKLSLVNEDLKSKNDRLSKKIQQLNTSISNFEEKLGDEEHSNNQLKDSFSKLQRKYDDLLQSEATLKKSIQVIKSDSCTQTFTPETASVSCMTIKPLLEEGIHLENRVAVYEDYNHLGDVHHGSEMSFHWNASEQNRNNEFSSRILSSEMKNMKLDSRLLQKHSLKPMKFLEPRQDLSYVRVEPESEKCLSRKTLCSNSFASPDYFLKCPFTYESRDSNRSCDSEDSEVMHYGSDHAESRVSSSNFRTQRLKHLSNLTMK